MGTQHGESASSRWPILFCGSTQEPVLATGNTENDHPILRKEVEAAIQSLKKGKSAGVDNIQAELINTYSSHDNLAERSGRQGNGQPHPTSRERQPAAVPELPNNQRHQPSKQSLAEDHFEYASGGDHRRRTGRLQSRKEHHRAALNLRILCAKHFLHQ